jgi:threonine dehydratase
MRALGADVREVGDDFDAAVAAARAHAAESGAFMLVDGDDTRISTGPRRWPSR